MAQPIRLTIVECQHDDHLDDHPYEIASKFIDEMDDSRWRPAVREWLIENVTTGDVVPVIAAGQYDYLGTPLRNTARGWTLFAVFIGCSAADMILFKMRWLS